jgi:hypothetical protein
VEIQKGAIVLAEIEAILVKHVDSGLITELLKEYVEMRKAHFSGDWPGVLNHSGMFCQAGIAVLNQVSTKQIVDVNQVRFDELYKQLAGLKKDTPELEFTTQIMPDVMRSVQGVRSKKRVTHIKAFNPDQLDAEYALRACSWCLSMLLLVLDKTQDPKEVGTLVEGIMEKQVPLIEEFEDGGIVVFEKLPFKHELLLALYKKVSRLPTSELARVLRTYPQNVNTALIGLAEEKLVHRNNDGTKITTKGIVFAESLIKRFNNA